MKPGPSGRFHAAHLWVFLLKLPNLKLKTWPKQLLGSLPLDIALPALYVFEKHLIRKTSVSQFNLKALKKVFDQILNLAAKKISSRQPILFHLVASN
jgi:hypothetical protein